MTSALGQFQAGFAKALFAPEDIADPAIRRLAAQPAFAVYRNTVMKGCVDALESNFPTVARLVGSEWFRAAAAVHVAAEPPRDGRLMHYGQAFADFLAHFEPAAGLAYLPGVARLDAMWCEAHAAADAELLDAGRLARCEADRLARLVLVPHPAARWRWFAGQPIFTIWQRNRSPSGTDHAGEMAWHGEGALITRPVDAVAWRRVSEADCAFLDACAAGLPLAEAAERALVVAPDVDLSGLLEGLLRAGAFCARSFQPAPESTP
jgi:hypothetical protein